MNPITREESLLDGQDLTPITRKEKFIKRIYDKTQEVPTPVTREEWFLNKAAEGSGGDVTIEQLSVTENGTYSEEGKAYSPVIVEVPAPTLITKTITENGTYNASEDNADGYSQVTVNVPYMEKKSASGDIASFSDGAGYPFLKVKANITPVQDLHGYDYPWVGGAGKNKFQTTAQSKEEGGVIWTVNSDGTVTVSGTATEFTSSELGYAVVNSSMGVVTISGIQDTTNIIWSSTLLRDENDEIISTITSGSTQVSFTVDLSQYPTVRKITMSVKRNNNAAVSGTIKPQVELGSTATSFAPYSNICPISGFTGVNVAVSPTTIEGSGTVYPISWQDEAGIVYGGYIDLVSGRLTKLLEGVDMGTLEWAMGTPSGAIIYNYFSANINDIKRGVSAKASNILSALYRTVPSDNVAKAGYDSTVAVGSTTVFVADSRYNSATDFKTAMSGQTLVYELETPQTYNLTPQQINTLIGQNNVWNNTNGQTEVEYFIPIE